MDEDEAVRILMAEALAIKGFEVTSADAAKALRLIATDLFEILVINLYMPDPRLGFAVIMSMRNAQPKALTLLVGGYPNVQSAMNAIVLQAGAIVIKPFTDGKLAELFRDKRELPPPEARALKERVAAILQRCTDSIVKEWLERVKKSKELNRVTLTDLERTGYLPGLIEDLIARLRAPNLPGVERDYAYSAAAFAHGKMRKSQGYTPGMLVHDSRILQVTLFGKLHENLSGLDFTLLLPDIMAIADEVDSQLTQAVDSYMNVAGTAHA